MSAEGTSNGVIAAEQLCAALWQALRDRLAAGEAEEAAALAERIAEVAHSVSALAHAEHRAQPTGPQGAQPVGFQGAQAVGSKDAQPDAGPAQAATHGQTWSASVASERQGAASGLGVGSRVALLVDEQAAVEPSIAIRDARHGVDASPWSIAVQRRLDRHGEDREPFAVLLLELLDAERLRLAQSPVEADLQVRDVEAGMVEQLRPADALVREADGRYWLIAPGTDAAAARSLAIRIANAARRGASHRSVPLEVAAGIAICPQHGANVDALIGHAEVDLYAAESAGSLFSDPDGA